MKESTNHEIYDVIVIGGGHAGCEAALAAARLDKKTALLVMNLDSIAMMPCNPNIGGTSKGHLVKEIDALGGEMGRNIDKTFIQSRMLNTAKGPAVYSLRAQADKYKYAQTMKTVLEHTENLEICQCEVTEVLVYNKAVSGIKTEHGMIYKAKSVIIATGTYLNSRCLTGEIITKSGPNGLKSSEDLSENLKSLGVRMQRFKTGSPARIDGRTIDRSKMVPQYGDEQIVPFSFENTEADIKRPQVECYLTYTNETTHQIIRESINRSPMYSGTIEGAATRYCPSIEDKIIRFADKDRHQLFVEPEGEDTNEMYISGMSTSMPADVQINMYRSVPGLENCRIMRYGYAIEYDCIDATQLTPYLMFKEIQGLFSAGQLNGSSGYEEAAAQGLIAGVNAALFTIGTEPFTLDRSDGYIGVLIDDLVIKGTNEPYRMMTSRAEYRLLLRQDNADLRLTDKGYHIGLISEERYAKFIEKKEQIVKEIKRVKRVIVTPSIITNALLTEYNSTNISSGVFLSDLIRRPELNYEILKPLDSHRPRLEKTVQEQVDIQINYEGYIARQMLEVEQFKKMENKKLPKHLDYSTIHGLRAEAVQKLNLIKPESLGQASRITGVSPADLTVLVVRMQSIVNM